MNQSKTEGYTKGFWRKGAMNSIESSDGIEIVSARAPEDAAHIVHCVNNFDELVGALEDFNNALVQLIEAEQREVIPEGDSEISSARASLYAAGYRARAVLKLVNGDVE